MHTWDTQKERQTKGKKGEKIHMQTVRQERVLAGWKNEKDKEQKKRILPQLLPA